jgi:RimJ/RimL family protein N-acetyltransferase
MVREHLVYRAVGLPDVAPIPKPEGYEFELWEPSLTQLLPRGAPRKTYAVWWAFDRARVFRNRDYAVLLGWKGGKLVHRLGVFPRYFRFPFMGRDDLQIGDVWTDPVHRGRGLAAYGLRFAIGRRDSSLPRTFWYLSQEANVASIRVAERVGFVRFGIATRTRRLGLRLLGQFQLQPVQGQTGIQGG